MQKGDFIRCSDSDHAADWTEDSESCRCWEGR